MTLPSEYHNVVKLAVQPAFPAMLALFGTLSLPLLLVSISPAQNSGAGSSAHAFSATTSSTAHVSANSTFPAKTSRTATPQSNNNRSQHTTANPPAVYFYYPYVYGVPIPYAADVLDNGASDDSDPNYQGGPTVFDRRGDGPSSYIPPGYESPAESNSLQAQAEGSSPAEYNPDSEPSPDPTVLIFKDGHQLEIGNYAIVNQTIYDLTPGHPRKIALADLDLPATQKLNDDHGITFDLPSAQAN
ncbi:MAG TPA: hypothetical protein VK930_10440 [Verrucomicrobiae bacterium]|jgi:hypothetical protein|nr:hypothetical protein [Verrucomicrobiae bacterium]